MTDTPLRATVTQRGAIVTPNEQVLIVQRASDGGWELPGGRLDREEATHEGLARELREETSLDPQIVAPVDTVAWVNNDGVGRFGVYYYCRDVHQEVSLSPEHDAAVWESAQAATARLSKPQTAAVKTAVDRHRQVTANKAGSATSTPHGHDKRS